jgi:hypothetical protein
MFLLDEEAVSRMDDEGGLCKVDQFCRKISSIIVFSGLSKFQTWGARSLIQVQWLALGAPSGGSRAPAQTGHNGSLCHRP